MTTSQPLPMSRLDLDDDHSVRAWADLTAHVFLQPPLDADALAFRRERSRDQRVSVVRDPSGGDATVAAFRSFDSDLSVPGGALVPANAVSGVVVASTHQRRGLLRRWIVADAFEAAERGAIAGALYASEATIYSRFGYGSATGVCSWTVDPRLARLRSTPSGSARRATVADVTELGPGIYDAARASSPGSIDRRIMWDVLRGTIPSPKKEELEKSWWAVHLNESGTPDGYVQYTVSDEWRDGVSQAVLTVQDLVAADAQASLGLWHYLLGIRFITSVRHELGSPHDLLPHALVDARTAVAGRTWDGLWARLLDIPAALSARRYQGRGAVRFVVHDPSGPAGGTFVLEVDDHGRGHATRARGEEGVGSLPSCELDVADLSGLWLGGGHGTTSLTSLVATGRARVTDPAAAPFVDSLLRWEPGPFSMTRF